MTTTSTNLGLTLWDSTTDQTVTFLNWRLGLTGPSLSSNINKIDTWAGTVNASILSLTAARGAIPVNASYISANYYEATVAAITAYSVGLTIAIRLDTTSNGTVTLQINALGTKSLMKIDVYGTPMNIMNSELLLNKIYLFQYDGTRWIWQNAVALDQISSSPSYGGMYVVVNGDGTLIEGGLPEEIIATAIDNVSEKLVPVTNDEFPYADSEATYVTKKIPFGTLKIVLSPNTPEGLGYNYVITPSVASNNLTVALKTIAGTDPSATDPAIIRIGNVMYTIAAALTTTKNAGTNWCNSGAAELKTKDIDFFVYLIQETGASAGTKIGFSRIPYAKTMNDFVNTNTDEKYVAGSWTNFNTSDLVENIGRFAAQSSGTASYNWSIPAVNVVSCPVFNTRSLDWTPTLGGTGTMTYTGTSVVSAKYIITDRECRITSLRFDGTTGGTATTILTFTSPFKHYDKSLAMIIGATLNADSTSKQGSATFSASTDSLVNVIHYDASAWGLGAARSVRFVGTYNIAGT